MNTDISSLADIAYKPWLILGSGGFAKKIIEYCNLHDVIKPFAVVSAKDDRYDEEYFKKHNIAVLFEKEFVYTEGTVMVLGTNVFHMQVLERFSSKLPDSAIVYDCSAELYSPENTILFDTHKAFGFDQDYDLLFDLNPAEHVQTWLHKFIEDREKSGRHVKVVHPLQKLSDEVLKKASSIYLWNGSVSVFEHVKHRLDTLDLGYEYMECGFFPQNAYFYIDKQGVNSKRSIATDHLRWVNAEMHIASDKLRERFFTGCKGSTGDYIFVPLQLQNDSNVQSNSRFTNGMQEFIDFIEEKYKKQKLIFKKHPKDPLHYTSKHGIFSCEDSRNLILGARLIHGINSTVLFEAALAGKPVIAEGECLLNHPYADMKTVVAAMVATQFPISGPFETPLHEKTIRVNIESRTNREGKHG